VYDVISLKQIFQKVQDKGLCSDERESNSQGIYELFKVCVGFKKVV